MMKKKHHLSDYEFDCEGKLGLIPFDIGAGFRWVHERTKHRYYTRLSDSNLLNGKRKLHLRVSTYQGISIGAMHYYASLRSYSPGVFNLTKKTGGHGGYVGVSKESPNYYDIGREFALDVKRRLTKVEKDMEGETLGKVGEYTNRFNTEEEAREAALVTFKRRFGPGWVLVGEWDEKILAET